MKICFHSNQHSLRGTEIALYSYSDYCEKLFGYESIILTKHPDIQSLSHPLGLKKFKDRFGDNVFYYKDFHNDGEKILKEQGVDILYMIKAGMNDGLISHNSNIKTVVHSVFQYFEPHSHKYAYVSEWLGRMFNSPFVPHMVDLPKIEGDLREELGIPNGATVFTTYGGQDSFNISFVHDAIRHILSIRNDIYFVFLYTNKFIDHKNAIFLDGTSDMIYKCKFLNTSDAHMSARIQGESFGLCICEAAFYNKPTIVYNGGRDQAHLEMLGDKAIKYNDFNDFVNIILNFDKNYYKSIDNNPYKEYTPEKVMKKFKEVFID